MYLTVLQVYFCRRHVTGLIHDSAAGADASCIYLESFSFFLLCTIEYTHTVLLNFHIVTYSCCMCTCIVSLTAQVRWVCSWCMKICLKRAVHISAERLISVQTDMQTDKRYGDEYGCEYGRQVCIFVQAFRVMARDLARWLVWRSA